MQEKQVFEYAVIRVVPRVEREEFLNAGVVVYCHKLKFLQARFTVDKKRFHAFCSTLNLEEIEEHLRAFERVCRGGTDAGPIGKLDMATRFRWLTATRSTVVQTSKVHPGFCTDPQATLAKLYMQLVL
jgi:hypothetical protein